MEKKTINQKLLEFQTSIDAIKKDGKNPHFKSTYATLTQILSEVKPILNALKLILTQPVVNGNVMTVITCCETGDKIESSIPITTGLSAQQVGSAITYFRRYTLTSLLALEIDEDDDGSAASQPVKQTKNEDDRPWLTEKQFNSAMVRIHEGEEGVYEKVDVAFRMKKEYRDQFKKLFA